MFERNFTRTFLWASAIFFLTSLILMLLRANWQGEPVTSRQIGAGLLFSAAFASIFAAVRGGALNLVDRAYIGPERPDQPVLALSKIRTFIKQERWEEAVRELEDLWARYPGDGRLMREYERVLLEGRKDAAGTALVFARFVPRLKGEDKAYAFLRLAEIHEQLKDKRQARHWCDRLLVEFPKSPLAGQARAMLDDPGFGREDPA